MLCRMDLEICLSDIEERRAHSLIVPAISQRQVVELLWAAAGPMRVPARPWPLQVAIETLAVRAPAGTRLAATVNAWPQRVTSSGRAYVGLDSILRDLVTCGHLFVEGRGWDAGYRPTPRWWNTLSTVLAARSRREQCALREAGQRLVACLASWSKNSRAPLPSRLETS
jgi:hypothetical protein